MPTPNDSDENAPAAVGASAAPPGFPRTPAGPDLETQMKMLQAQFSGMQFQLRELVDTIDTKGRDEETKTEVQPMNPVNTAIDKEKYAKDDDVKHLAKIVIPETVRADTTKSFASQLDGFATVCGLHGPVARSVVSFPSQPCWSHDFSVEDSMAYMVMDAEISAEISSAYERSGRPNIL